MTTRTLDMANVIASDVTIAGDKTLSGDITFSGDVVPSTPLSHRNFIINGAMQVAQRGTSFTNQGAANTIYTLDRWATEWYQGTETAKFTITQDTLGATDTPRLNEGLRFAYKLDCTTAIADQNANANNLQSLDYRIEAQDLQSLRYGTANAQTVCLSFWWKSPKAGIHTVFLMQSNNSNKIYIREFTITSANTWQKIEVTFPGDTSGVINNDNSKGMRIGWPLYAGNNRHGSKDEWREDNVDYTTSNQQNLLDNTSNNIYITGVQLELGDNATPFEHRSFADELTRCHRYFYRLNGATDGTEVDNQWYYMLASSGANQYGRATIQHPVEMRTTVTVTNINNTGNYTGTGTQFLGKQYTTLFVNSVTGITKLRTADISAEL